MLTKACAKLETWRPRLVRDTKHNRHFDDVITMALIDCLL